jgi:hypothetical protein
MKLPLSVCALVVIATSCQCGRALTPCEATNCGPGLECAPSTGKCVVSGSTGGGGGTTGDAGVCAVACAGATPVCDSVAQRCVVCARDLDCPSATPFCATTVQPAGACYACRTELDCPGASMTCDLATHVCAPFIDAGAGGGGGGAGGGGGGGGGFEPVVYGHTATTLYKVNATTKVVTAVADFHNCDSDVIDLALDAYSHAFVTTLNGLYRLDLSTANCTAVNPASTDTYPNSLSFVPKGTLDPSFEALVGYSGSSYVRINLVTGVIQQIGTLGGGFVSSGDIVSVNDGGTYLTVKDPNGSPTTDFLVEVNPATGGLVRNFGALPFNNVYGLAFWGGSLYGFSNGGTLFEITINGSSTTSAAVPNAMNEQWNGAGSTTAAALR